ncbi:FtsB family cell division protein [Aquidulcibacter paucihalophilus]|uniref:FtsB family cell division protein n=1 Tax=Aquidulcibacter paucihalophilus TaxID=1978549 RepID=UPI000A18F0C9|nr:septum formation initiator family protein [Aquidulcibacter paucihalophilus]
MAFLKGIRISTFLFSGVLVYFAVHFFIGQQGVLSWHSYAQTADRLMAERDVLVKQRAELERKLARYRAGQVDSDYVEERAMSQLGLAGPDDIALSLPKTAVATPSSASSQTPNP